MKEKDNTQASEVQETFASRYCTYRCLNHDILLDYLVEEVDTEYVAWQIDQAFRHDKKTIRWGTVYRACMDSGVLAPMGIAEFHKMLRNLIPDFKFDRTTLLKGTEEYDGKCMELRRGELMSPDDLTFINAKEQLQAKLKGRIS